MSEFFDISSEEAIRKAFQRLEQRGKIVRLARGIYIFPKKDTLLGTILPTAREVAIAVADKEGVTIIPTGDQALLQLGFTTQVPMKLTFVTSGGPKNFKLGKRTIVFKPGSSKYFNMRSKVLPVIVQALKAMGKEAVTEAVIQKLKLSLQGESRFVLEADALLAPAWIRAIIQDILTQSPST